jgi:phage-related protein
MYVRKIIRISGVISRPLILITGINICKISIKIDKNITRVIMEEFIE